MSFPKINVCDVNRWLANIEESPSKLVAKCIQMIKASAPDIIHECPYTVRIFNSKVIGN